MDSNAQLYLLPYLISAIISLSIGFYALRFKTTNGAISFSIFVFAQSFWTIGFIFELTNSGIEEKIFWDNIQWIGALIWPVAFLNFVQHFSSLKSKNNFRNLLLTLPITIVCLLLIFTNHLHQLIGHNYQLNQGEPFAALEYDFGSMVWVIVLYFYGLILLSIFHLLKLLFRSQQYFRKQIVILIIGILIPIIGTMYTFLDISLTLHRDITPFTFTASNFVILWGLLKFGFLNVVPIARDQLIENMNDAVIVFDTQDRVVDVNPVALKWIKKESRQVIGLPIKEVFKEWSDLLEYFQNESEVNKEIKFIYNMKVFFFNLSVSLILDDHKKELGKLLILHDITKRKWAEEELKKINDELENRIKARTLEITQVNEALREEISRRKQIEKNLIVAKEQAETANISKSRFLENMSHELRTPVHHISGFAQLGIVKFKKLPEEKIVSYFRTIETSAKGLLNLLNNLLNLASFETKSISFHMSKTNLSSIVQASANELQSMVNKKGIQLLIEEPANSTNLICDLEKIQQVVKHLLHNAIQFTPNQESIFISLDGNKIDHQNESRDGSITKLTFRIKDNGIGIPDAELSSVFDKFTLSSKTNTGAGGTGLGLPICKEIIEAHSGVIWAENNPNGGATFSFTIPCEQIIET